MSAARRAGRLWVAIAAAALWAVAVGVEEEVKRQEKGWREGLGEALPGRRQAPEADEMAGGGKRPDRVFAPGLAHVVTAWPRGASPLPGRLTPGPWPQPDHASATLSEEAVDPT